jgi:hypothetical protein
MAAFGIFLPSKIISGREGRGRERCTKWIPSDGERVVEPVEADSQHCTTAVTTDVKGRFPFFPGGVVEEIDDHCLGVAVVTVYILKKY